MICGLVFSMLNQDYRFSLVRYILVFIFFVSLKILLWWYITVRAGNLGQISTLTVDSGDIHVRCNINNKYREFEQNPL
jgi:hypothetical protein